MTCCMRATTLTLKPPKRNLQHCQMHQLPPQKRHLRLPLLNPPLTPPMLLRKPHLPQPPRQKPPQLLRQRPPLPQPLRQRPPQLKPLPRRPPLLPQKSQLQLPKLPLQSRVTRSPITSHNTQFADSTNDRLEVVKKDTPFFAPSLHYMATHCTTLRYTPHHTTPPCCPLPTLKLNATRDTATPLHHTQRSAPHTSQVVLSHPYLLLS
ncbi:uncharacterized protein LOC134457393 isoform X1 [Engraulis encrasicolus]|uniref:uncharacterized protein LOC134457393 isoform X1 n=1 Tax=Engraulis encrasicolus TaxID=184585 RepID=UPI002FCF28A2